MLNQKKEVKQSHPVDIHVGKKLRSRRSLLGLSQDALAQKMGITFQQIQKYERGVNRIGSSRLYEFSNHLNTNVDYFFEDYDNASSGLAENKNSFDSAEIENSAKGNSKETLALIKAYYEIKEPKVRKRVLALVKSMSGDIED